MKRLDWIKKGFLLFVLTVTLQILFCVPTMAGYVPTGLRQTKAGHNWIGVEADDDVSAWLFEYQYSTDKVRWSGISYFTPGSKGGSIWSLQEGTSYYVRIRSKYNNNSVSEWCEPVIMTTTPHDVATPVAVSKTADSVTVRIGGSMTATGYRVICKREGYEVQRKIIPATQSLVTFAGLDPDVKYQFEATALRSTDNFTAISTAERYKDIHTLPRRITGLKLEDGLHEVNRSYNFVWNSPNNYQDGYQLEYRDLRTNKKYYTTTRGSRPAVDITLGKDRFYKVRIRSYNICDQYKKCFSPWSGYKYMHSQSAPNLKRVKNSIRASWKKVAGATSYTLYVKEAYAGNVYHKVCTTKKTNAVIKKIQGINLQENRAYYFIMKANKKVGRRTYRSEASDQVSFYFRKNQGWF